MKQQFTNLEILCFVLGWHGGTIHQVAEKLSVSPVQILNASEVKLRELVRIAQYKRNKYIDPILPKELA